MKSTGSRIIRCCICSTAAATEQHYRRFLGVPRLYGETGFTSTERTTARPTFEINGLTSGYQGEGGKTIVPAWARAKITMRLVPDQNPDAILKSTTVWLKRHCPPTVRIEIARGHGAMPYLVDPTSAHAQAAVRALHEAFGCEPVLMREGGSIPIVTDFKRILGADTLLLGLALPDANAHSPMRVSISTASPGASGSAPGCAELAHIPRPGASVRA